MDRSRTGRSTGSHRLCDRWSSGGPAEETAEWMAVTRARSASQPRAGADSSTPNPGKPFGTRSPLYRCWPHRLSTSGGNDAGVLRKLGPQKPKAPPVATLFLRWSSAAPAVSHSVAQMLRHRRDSPFRTASRRSTADTALRIYHHLAQSLDPGFAQTAVGRQNDFSDREDLPNRAMQGVGQNCRIWIVAAKAV